MSILIAPIPLFDSNMEVKEYLLSSQSGEKLLGTRDNFLKMDEAFSHAGLDMVEQVGIEPFTGGKRLFILLSRMQLMSGLIERVRIDKKYLVCTISAELISDQDVIPDIQKLYAKGYEFALDGFPTDIKSPAMDCVKYIVLDYEDSHFQEKYMLKRGIYPDKIAVICGIPDMATYHTLLADTNAYFTGVFYRRPIIKSSTQLSPIKVNALRLLNHINQEDFELEDIVKTIEQDPYLSVSLLKFLNSTATGLRRRVDSIQHAVTILGQKSVRRWAMISLSASLGEDRPSEITRLALIRAKFAEGLAGAFELGVYQSALFIAGLFSLLDVMLERPMKEAIKEVAVSQIVESALLEKKGPLATVMELIYDYERAEWDNVSILAVQNHTDIEAITKAYLDALNWYRDLLQSIEQTEAEEEETTDQATQTAES